ncbi:tautomerase family protein [Ruegeria sp. 2205SS24-7]|uniref:tautomerase family protein n=1 Tax=Ruegeria discodermiae TaxID=3064389 RepID=UPI00274068B2|nr:tautomerase family protein [Ruegeria sp. 2205SS24-7]MDP5217954.1 tautomerase family protein [Ruegeria sp. 2205SS24-7]
MTKKIAIRWIDHRTKRNQCRHVNAPLKMQGTFTKLSFLCHLTRRWSRAHWHFGKSRETENAMPSIEIQVLEGVFSAEEKGRIIQKVTDAFGEVAGQTIKAGTSVRLLEVSSGSWGYAGNVLTTQDALEMRARG